MSFWNVIVLLCFSLSSIEGGELKLPVYTQPYSTDQYIYKTDLPALSQATICFWMNTGADDDNRISDHFFSIATSHNDNELLIFWNYQNLVFRLRGADIQIASNEARMDSLWIGWHKHCFTWTAGDTMKWYADETISGVLELIGSASVNTNTVRSGGALVLFHDQDSVMGGFDINQVIEGKLAWFNMWDYEMTLSEMQALGCRVRGNVIEWDDLQVVGTSGYHYETFPCNDGEKTVQAKQCSGFFQAMMFCKIVGSSLENHQITTETVSTAARCMLMCIRTEDCLSANYQISTGSCSTNDVVDQGHEGNFTTDLSSDFVHFTSRECVD